jgi:Domain of unknown function (DUF4760)
MSATQISALSAALGAVTGVVLLIFVVIQLRLLSKQLEETRQQFANEQKRLKQISTLENMNETTQYRHQLSRQMPLEYDSDAVKRFIESAKSNLEDRQLLGSYLNYYENLAAGINIGVYDLDIVDRTVGSLMLRVFDRYEPYIRYVRKKDAAPAAYAELEAYATLMGRGKGAPKATVHQAVPRERLEQLPPAPRPTH